ncbi:uncharacterized protein LOC128958554 [Oppia nitens]|uniref:uncharacterized protein LOC128958554 n=1 Tax=Oppia nitens TaxID=1686743 RepID=UPI0023DC11BD|nr:uncharacterized protein LOC128958554 [Oppia nitens]
MIKLIFISSTLMASSAMVIMFVPMMTVMGEYIDDQFTHFPYDWADLFAPDVLKAFDSVIYNFNDKKGDIQLYNGFKYNNPVDGYVYYLFQYYVDYKRRCLPEEHFKFLKKYILKDGHCIQISSCKIELKQIESGYIEIAKGCEPNHLYKMTI